VGKKFISELFKEMKTPGVSHRHREEEEVAYM
jgi:hypothetical protein